MPRSTFAALSDAGRVSGGVIGRTTRFDQSDAFPFGPVARTASTTFLPAHSLAGISRLNAPGPAARISKRDAAADHASREKGSGPTPARNSTDRRPLSAR